MVSVIIPVYNGAALLEESLKTVLRQSYTELQIIIVDDGSTDDTYAICQRFAEQDSRILLVRQKNAGVSAARNRGISMAKGEYVLFMDADDLMPENAVRAMIEACAPDVDLIVGSHEEFRGSKVDVRRRKPETITKADFVQDSLRVEKLIRAAWGKLYRMDIIQKNGVRYDLTIPFMEDTIFTWHYCKYVNKIRIIDQIVYRYRLGGVASTQKYYPQRYRYFVAALEAYSGFYGGREQIPGDFLKEKVTGGLLDCIIHYLCHCPKQEARANIRITLEAYAPYLCEQTLDQRCMSAKLVQAILKADVDKIMSQVYQKAFFRIVAKKIKNRLQAPKNEKKKTKVGIVTIFDNENLGNRLQNYALQNTLEAYASTVVTIKNKPRFASCLQNLKRTSPLAESITANRLLGKRRKVQMLRFNKAHISMSRKCYWSNVASTKLKKADCCDLYCVGSDQIWNPAAGRRNSFDYLGFADREKTFSYAASFGVDTIEEQYQQVVRTGLQHIKYISVREDAGKKIVEELTGRTDAQVLVDPTMLLTPEAWDRVISAPCAALPEKYVLTYFLGKVTDERRAALLEKAQQLDCQLIELMDPTSPFHEVGPDGFVYLIKHARLVCTDSFHGSVFSFLYGRPLAIFNRQDKGPDMGSRMKTFMSKFALEGCYARDDVIPELPEQPDYSTGYATLEAERNKAKTFLDQVFRETEG